MEGWKVGLGGGWRVEHGLRLDWEYGCMKSEVKCRWKAERVGE